MLAVLRVAAVAVFITSGTMKMFGDPPSPTPMPPISLMSQMGIGALLEIVGGVIVRRRA